MANHEHSDDRIAEFLGGRMSSSEESEFRAELTRDPELNKEVIQMREIRAGLDATEIMAGGHLSTRVLAAYADDPSNIESTTQREVSRHLDLCSECREELRLCREAVPAAMPINPFMEIVRWLFSPQSAFRPAYVLGLLAILVVPLTYVAMQTGPGGDGLSVKLVPSGMRAPGDSVRVITITPGLAWIRLESTLPDLENKICTFTLIYDSDQTREMTRQDSLRGNSVVLDIPASYLRRDGGYTLLVSKSAEPGGEEVIPFKIPFQIFHSN